MTGDDNAALLAMVRGERPLLVEDPPMGVLADSGLVDAIDTDRSVAMRAARKIRSKAA